MRAWQVGILALFGPGCALPPAFGEVRLVPATGLVGVIPSVPAALGIAPWLETACVTKPKRDAQTA